MIKRLLVLLCLTLLPAICAAQTGWAQVPSTLLSSVNPGYSDIQGGTGQPAVESAWGGAFVDNNRNCMIITGGGHSDYYGDEVYAVCFTSPTTATVVVMHGPAHGTTFDSQLVGWSSPQVGGGAANNANCPEAVTDSSGSGLAPNARHTYNEIFYLPNLDFYWYMGGGLSGTFVSGPSNCGNFDDGVWAYNPNTASGSPWTQLPQTVHTTTATAGDVAIAGFNDADHNIYLYQNNAGTFWKASLDTTSGNLSTAANVNWTSITAPSGAPCPNDNMGSAIDVSRQLLVCAGGNWLGAINLSTAAVTNDSAASGCSVPANATAPGIDYDPVLQLIIIWAGGNTVYEYNATAHTCTAMAFTGGPGTALPNGTYGRFKYLPGIGAHVVANGTTTNIYTLTLTASATAPTTDFTNRCAASGVIVCDQLSSTSNLPQLTCASAASGLYPATCPSTTYAGVDNTTYRSNGGSLEFTIPGMSGTAPEGYYRRLFTPLQSTVPGTNDSNLVTFGNNSDFYISYAQLMDSAFINNVASTGSATTYWKQQIISWSGSTCGQLEITTVNDNMEGYPLTYGQCGALPYQVNSSLAPNGIFNEFNKNLMLSGTYNASNQTLTGGALNGSTYNCPYASTQPNANCFDYPANVWVTYYYHVHIGTFGSANSLVEGFVSTPSSPAWRQWLYFPNLTLTLDAGNTWGFDMVTLIPYWTGRSASVCSTPCTTAHTWYNELIVSSKPILPPQAPPATPSVSTPIVSLSPTSVAFSNQSINTSSGAQTITLTNIGTATLNIASIALTGTNAANFGTLNSTCGSTLGAGLNCTIQVTFSPLAVQSYSASLTFTTNAPSSPDNVTLTGTGALTGVVLGSGKIIGAGIVQ